MIEHLNKLEKETSMIWKKGILAGRVAQVVQDLPSKHKILSSNSSATK
jgi:hypothetical protein